MRFLKLIKKYPIDFSFAGLIIIAVMLYFVVYMTPGKGEWYRNTGHEILVAVRGFFNFL